MVCYKTIYYNLLAIKNNIIINFLLLGNIVYPSYFNEEIIKYKKIGEDYYKYIIFLNFGETFKQKYDINIIDIGLSLYDNYNILMNNNNDDNLSVSSDISDLSDISNLSCISD